MRTNLAAIVCLLALVGSACAETEPATCDVADPPGPAVDVTTVCGHLLDLGCRIDEDPELAHADECSAAYVAQQAKLTTDDFARLTSCYAQARSCTAVASCSRACVPPPAALDAGP